jgi:hypothetical protein
VTAGASPATGPAAADTQLAIGPAVDENGRSFVLVRLGAGAVSLDVRLSAEDARKWAAVLPMQLEHAARGVDARNGKGRIVPVRGLIVPAPGR